MSSSPSDPSLPVSVIILAKNEERNIGRTLESLVGNFDEIIVVDSMSTDSTKSIASSYGARVVDFVWNGRYPKKKQWSLDFAGAVNNWVLLLDADERVTTELVHEIRRRLGDGEKPGQVCFDISLSYRFAGRTLRFGHKVVKRALLDRTLCRFPEVEDLHAPGIREVEGHYQPQAQGAVGRLKSKIVHDDLDPVSSWFERHNRYSSWEAHLRLQSELRKNVAASRSRQGQLFDRMPFKPLAFFTYAYIFRLGFLDGRAGLDYAVALSTYYWQIGLKKRELEVFSGTKPEDHEVVQVINSVGREYGGPASAARGLMNAATATRAWRPILITTDAGLTRAEVSQLSAHGAKVAHSGNARLTYLGVSLGLFLRIVAELRSSRTVLIHGLLTPYALFALLVARWRGVEKLYVQPHGSLEPYERENWSVVRELAWRAIARNLGRASFVAATRSEAEGIRNALPRATVFVLPMGVQDTRLTTEASEQFRRTTSTGHGGTSETGSRRAGPLLFVGRIAEKKRLDLVIEALSLVNTSEERCLKLVVIGDGPPALLQNYKALAASKGVSHLIDWRGKQDAAQVDAELARAFALVLPSENENFAHVVVEAVAAGCPVILTQQVALAEWAENLGVGVSIPTPDSRLLAKTVQELMQSERLFGGLCEAARSASQEVRWSNRVTDWQRVLTAPANRHNSTCSPPS